MPNRRQSSRRLASGCIASRTNSRRSSITDTSRHGMDGLLAALSTPIMMCRPCPRTPVGYVPGLYTCPGHPRLNSVLKGKTWMSGTRAGHDGVLFERLDSRPEHHTLPLCAQARVVRFYQHRPALENLVA